MIWLSLPGDVCKRFNWVCHAYCQMTNHYHVVLNPVRASMVSSPDEWPWSSYRAMIAMDTPLPWLQPIGC